MLHSCELGSYAWLTVVEIDDCAVKDQRKYLPGSLPIHIVFRKAKKYSDFSSCFLLCHDKRKPRKLWSVTLGVT